MSYTERDYMKMARDSKFMAQRWKQRLSQNEKELSAKWATLSPQERKKRQSQVRSMAKMVKKYETK